MKKIEDSPLKNQADGQPIYKSILSRLRDTLEMSIV